MTPNETIDRMRNILAFILVAAFITALGAMFAIVIPSENKEIVTYMVGQLSGMVTSALALYFVTKVGQEMLEARRADTTDKMADAVVAATNSTPGPTTGDVIRPGDDVTINKAEDRP